jgi:hypothetical protein
VYAGGRISVRRVVETVKVRSAVEVTAVLALCSEGVSTSEVARRCGIPRSTVKDWRNGRGLQTPRECAGHDLQALDRSAYAYLLGMYLGDGCLSKHCNGTWRLRVTLDAAYPGIVAECERAMRIVRGGTTNVLPRGGDRAVEVSSYWNHWPCLIPQHGPGRKHDRRILLADWQQQIVVSEVERFLRGLIHSDGTRIVARERKGNYVRFAPRYAFSNRSEDILEIFRGACEMAGVHCTRASEKQIAVYSKDAVARLDEFVGPKS